MGNEIESEIIINIFVFDNLPINDKRVSQKYNIDNVEPGISMIYLFNKSL